MSKAPAGNEVHALPLRAPSPFRVRPLNPSLPCAPPPQDYFARLPNLRLSEYTPVSVRVYGDFATQAGTYTFAWMGADGSTKEKRARFSFTFRRDPESPTAWTIVEHHSSSMPTSPAELKHVRNSGTAVF